jgi:hypothetical protein
MMDGLDSKNPGIGASSATTYRIVGVAAVFHIMRHEGNDPGRRFPLD